MGSNPVTPTKKEDYRSGNLLFLLQSQIFAVSCLSRTNCEGPGIEYDRCLWQMKGDFSSGSDLVKTSEVTMRSLNLSRNRKRARI